MTDPANARQALDEGEPIGGTGVRFVPLAHEGSGNRSPVEAAWVAETIGALVGRRWVDRDGRARTLEVPDILVVAPYNAQVAEIARTVERRLGVRPNVGTVDKFQGREAPVAIYSMATSTPERRAARPRVPVLGQPAQRRSVTGQGARGAGRLPRPASGRLSVARADAAGQRVLPVRGGRGRADRRTSRGGRGRGPVRRGHRDADRPGVAADRGPGRSARPLPGPRSVGSTERERRGLTSGRPYHRHDDRDAHG